MPLHICHNITKDTKTRDFSKTGAAQSHVTIGYHHRGYCYLDNKNKFP